MKYISVNRLSPPVSFSEALLGGIAPDGGLYIPESFPTVDASAFGDGVNHSLHSIGTDILAPFIDDIPRAEIAALVEQAWDFPFPLTRLDDNIFLLELFHGPTLAFKDVGARFMAHAMSRLLVEEHRDLTVIVATSGDTGSAVAHGFFNVPHVEVFILFPSGKISRLQEQQMTTLGGNITAVEIEGSFDDCQRLVKRVLVDNDVQRRRTVTTANSINLARLLPQIVYFGWSVIQLRTMYKSTEPPVIVVPSGNFGNITAAAYGKRVGIPIRNFIAATNANDGVLQYLHTGIFVPRPSIKTYSNAMDVGSPSNLARLHDLYGNDVAALKNDIDAVSITDNETLEEIKTTHERTGVVLDPHTAVGVAAARKSREWTTHAPPIIVAATAHPAKFPDVIAKAVKVNVPLPDSLAAAASHPKHTIRLGASYHEWKQLLMNTL